jgi:trehalose 6-phosphate phosphatase
MHTLLRWGIVDDVGPRLRLRTVRSVMGARSGNDPTPRALRVRELPDALPVRDRFGSQLRGELAVFLDYDGTLTPIVDDPDAALLPEPTRTTIEQLAAVVLVAIVSGRDLDDVRHKVGIDGLAYAGSHGLDILHPDGTRRQLATEYTGELDRAQASLEDELGGVPGVRIERKRFAIAVHDRQVDDPDVRTRIAAVVAGSGEAHAGLRATGGKRIHELRPDIDWDKGRAIEALMTELDAEDHLPVYLGDDLTDEDGFRAVKARAGIAVVVRGEDDDRRSIADAALDTTEDSRRFLAELHDLATGATAE